MRSTSRLEITNVADTTTTIASSTGPSNRLTASTVSLPMPSRLNTVSVMAVPANSWPMSMPTIVSTGSTALRTAWPITRRWSAPRERSTVMNGSVSVTSRLRANNCASVAPVGMARVIAGRMRDSTPELPDAGRSPSRNENS